MPLDQRTHQLQHLDLEVEVVRQPHAGDVRQVEPLQVPEVAPQRMDVNATPPPPYTCN